MNLQLVYLDSIKSQFHYYKKLAEKAMNQLEPEQLFVQPKEDVNSIGTIVKHMCGNILSRWTDFLTADGEKDWRDRDAEFENDWANKEELLASWDEAWACFFQAIDSLQPEQLSQIVYIRNEGHTVLEAINRQLAHYPYHIGQIVYAAKGLKEHEWNSLSVPKNGSKQYNAGKFAKEKAIKHFTDEELKRLDGDREGERI
ncbi:hypothetical protein BBD42_25705 [Paenibacillus sp. BIHB 4019]|uniref:DUF1572 domain-containing protein n=1 Tax=Paenibacillus sp. BIHB 4019 TaxID=1870819 RepID=A0A1B2DP66_9BACL|nr:DUF1572 family protein [Paenibacillus sp. BIHB 4019]ANY69500.1 hypothetical protein BBD42_25705 [Paenibacillus sp. BIHB 4019]